MQFILSVLMLNVITLSVVMLNVVMLNVVMLNVAAPCKTLVLTPKVNGVKNMTESS